MTQVSEERVAERIEAMRRRPQRFRDERITMAHGAGGKAEKLSGRWSSRNLIATRIAPAPYAPRHEVTHVLMNETWAVGATSQGTPLFWVNLVNGSVGRADLAPLAPLRPLDGSYCTPQPALLDDGSLALGLRDDSSAGVYVGQLTQAPWRRLGRPVANVAGVGAIPYPRALVVAANSGRNTFCDGGAWPPPESVPAGTLLGDSVQVVMPDLPDREVVFEDHNVSEFVFHESGLCAVVRGFVHDFPTGERTELPPDASQVTFW